MKNIRLVAIVAMAFALAGCGGFVPKQGPSSVDVALMSGEGEVFNSLINVVTLDEDTLAVLGRPIPKTFSAEFRNTIQGDALYRIGIGDRMTINIWEASPDGLFSTIDSKKMQLEAVVDEDGLLFIPYAGQIDVVAKTVEQVRAAIQEGLKGKAVEPQVQIALTSNGSHKFSVVGDVAKPGRYEIHTSGLRLIDAIAEAGGTRQASFSTVVTIVRDHLSGTVRLEDVLSDPQNNVWLKPGDTVHIINSPKTFSAFGAVGSKNQLEFKTEQMSLAEALAQSGGLNDNLANAQGVFLFRFEPPARLQQAQIKPKSKLINGHSATIYRLDLTEPESFFLARGFDVSDKDILYVANASGAQLRKFFSIILSPLLSSASTASNL